MKKVLLVIVSILVVAVVILGIIAPTELAIERETIINQPKEFVFEKLLILQNHYEWSPWFKLDPNIKVEYSGVDGTVGFVSRWAGNDKVGVGEQEILSITPGERIDYELRFKEPMEDTSSAYLITETWDNGQTKVRWGMKGKNPFPANIFCMLMNINGKLTKDFDDGLAMLKSKLEN